MTHRRTLRCLAERAPALRSAARWPAPLRRWFLRRSADPAAAAEALALASADDRAFCRRVRLGARPDVWRSVWRSRDEPEAEVVVFELQDPDGEMLWPVALRALILFAGARCGPGEPGPGVGLPGETPPEAEAVRIPVRVRRLAEPSVDADFVVDVGPSM